MRVGDSQTPDRASQAADQTSQAEASSTAGAPKGTLAMMMTLLLLEAPINAQHAQFQALSHAERRALNLSSGLQFKQGFKSIEGTRKKGLNVYIKGLKKALSIANKNSPNFKKVMNTHLNTLSGKLEGKPISSQEWNDLAWIKGNLDDPKAVSNKIESMLDSAQSRLKAVDTASVWVKYLK